METRARRPAGRAGEADPTEWGPGSVGSAWPPRPGQSFKPRSRRLPRRVTRRSRDLGSTSRHRPASPLLALFCGCWWARLPPRPRRSARVPRQLRRENQSYRSHGPQLQSPRRRRGASPPRYSLSVSPESGGPSYRVRSRGEPRRQEAPSRRWDAVTRAPRPLCPTEIFTSDKRALRLREGSAWGILTLGLAGPRSVGTSPGKTRGLAPGCPAPAGSIRAAASEGRPLPSSSGPAAAACAPPSAPPIAPPRPAGPAHRALRPRPVPLPLPNAATPFPGRFPPLLSARREQSALWLTRGDVEILPPKWAVISFWWL